VNESGQQLQYDTYYFGHGNNMTVNITVRGHTSSDETIVHNFLNVSLNNFFTPVVTVMQEIDLGNKLYNFTWNSTDLNADDVHFYSVWISSDGGSTYQLLSRNLTQRYYVWNSTGFLQRDFQVRVKAYSVDLSVYSGPFLSIPSDYWPGDFGLGFSVEFAGDHIWPWPIPGGIPNIYILQAAADLVYVHGMTGNSIDWKLDADHAGCDMVYLVYRVYQNETLHTTGNSNIFDPVWVSINIDGLMPGVYQFKIEFINPGPNGGTVTDSVWVRVLSSGIFPPLFGFGVGIGFGALILVILFGLRKVQLRPSST
jgi:hypothetical protein